MGEGKRYPTIYDVAERANVSIGTVSKALNTPARVAEPTRRRVLDAVAELNFVPKAAATSRARKGVGRIGVFAPFSSFESFHQRLNGVLLATSTAASAIEVVVFDVESAAESARALESLPSLRSLDGLIIMSVPFGEKPAAAMRRARMPVVLVDLEGHGFPSVTTDDKTGGALAADRLITTGRRHLAFLGHSQVQQDHLSASLRRFDGFSQRVADHGVDLPPSRVLLVPRGFDATVAGIEALLRDQPDIDGIFAHTDELAAIAQLAVRAAGRRVPEDVAVIGFDDGSTAVAADLTTVRQELRESGRWAAANGHDAEPARGPRQGHPVPHASGLPRAPWLRVASTPPPG